MAPVDDKEVGRRVRAARSYKGLPSVRALAEAIDEEGMGTTTLYAIEQGRRYTPPRELAAIARACDLPAEFFTMDFAAAAQAVDERSEVSQLRDDVAALQEHLRRLRADIEVALAEAPPRSGGTGQTRTGPSQP